MKGWKGCERFSTKGWEIFSILLHLESLCSSVSSSLVGSLVGSSSILVVSVVSVSSSSVLVVSVISVVSVSTSSVLVISVSSSSLLGFGLFSLGFFFSSLGGGFLSGWLVVVSWWSVLSGSLWSIGFDDFNQSGLESQELGFLGLEAGLVVQSGSLGFLSLGLSTLLLLDFFLGLDVLELFLLELISNILLLQGSDLLLLLGFRVFDVNSDLLVVLLDGLVGWLLLSSLLISLTIRVLLVSINVSGELVLDGSDVSGTSLSESVLLESSIVLGSRLSVLWVGFFRNTLLLGLSLLNSSVSLLLADILSGVGGGSLSSVGVVVLS